MKPHEIHEWVTQAGYEHYCFISWPHAGSRFLQEVATRLHDELEDTLKEKVNQPSVFLDRRDIPPGAKWEELLGRDLCHSLCMVALCMPVYFSPDRAFCGREWAAMEVLGDHRFKDPKASAIVPVLVSSVDRLPKAVQKYQYIDITKERTRGRKYFKSDDFDEVVWKISERVWAAATAVAERRVKPGCEAFQLPDESAFADYHAPKRAHPLRAS